MSNSRAQGSNPSMYARILRVRIDPVVGSGSSALDRSGARFTQTRNDRRFCRRQKANHYDDS